MESTYTCPECGSNIEAIEDDEETKSPFGTPYMCMECGHEATEASLKYKNFKVGKVTEVEDKGKLKVFKVIFEEDGEPLQIVTNAKHVDEDQMVVIACEGAIVPAGAESEADGGQGIEVKKASVGGNASSGMLCDAPMLAWTGGAAGVPAKVEGFDYIELGGVPPMTRPIKQ